MKLTADFVRFKVYLVFHEKESLFYTGIKEGR